MPDIMKLCATYGDIKSPLIITEVGNKYGENNSLR